MIKIIASAILASILPFSVSANTATADACKEYSKTQGDNIVKKYNITFNKVSEPLAAGKINRIENWDKTEFYGRILLACVMGADYAKKDITQQDSIDWSIKGAYETMRVSSYGKIPGDALLQAIKDAVIFGRGLKATE